MRSAKTARGYTLVELIIALGVSVIVIAGALALATAQQRTFVQTSHDRGLQEGARVALGNITGTLRDAGFGVDPALAFDLGPMSNVRSDRAYAGLTFSTTASLKGDGSACTGLCRDQQTGPDEIVFYSRDPMFGPHPLTSSASNASTSLTVALVPDQENLSLQKGQVLLVACYTGNMTWAYVTVSGAPTANGDGTATVPIVSGGNNFPNQTEFLADSCFSSVATMSSGAPVLATLQKAAQIFKIDKYHYYVRSYDAGGTAVTWNTAGSRPYLMLEQGLYSSGKLVTSVVAPDVEDLQFGYVFPYDTVTPLVGSSPGIAIPTDDTGINLAPTAGCPAYSDPVIPAPALTRQNHHPGNIGAVRVSVVVRSSTPDSTNHDPVIPPSGNRGAVDGESGYARLRIETTVRVPNLSSEAPYYPTYGSAAAPGNREQNVGGG